MEDFIQTALPVIAIILGVVIIVIYVVVLNRKINGNNDSELSTEEVEDRRRVTRRAQIVSYVDNKKLNFLNALKSALPKNYIIYPNVSVELLFHYSQRQDIRLLGQYADFCVFTENHIPTLIIDLMDLSLTGGDSVLRLRKTSKDTIIRSGIAVMEYNMRDTYNIDDLRKAIAKAMNPLYADKK